MRFQEVVAYFGGANKAAVALGMTRQAVYLWKQMGIPRSRQLHLEQLSRGKLKARGGR